MKITRKAGIKADFNAFVNEYKNGNKYLSQKGKFLFDGDGNKLPGIDDDTYYRIAGKGLKKESLEAFKKGEKIAIQGMVFGDFIKEEVWTDGSKHYTIIVC